MADCFVVMPVTTPPPIVERYGGDANHFAHVLEHLFAPAAERAGFIVIKPTSTGSQLIQAEIVRRLERAEMVLCDISSLNPNVFFELGIRTALDLPVCLVRDDQTAEIPFDTGMINCHTYKSGLHPWHLKAEIDSLADHLKAAVNTSGKRNALWQYFGLTQRGAEAIRDAPDDPQGAALRMILGELQQLRTRTSVPLREPGELPDEVFVEIPGDEVLAERANNFLRVAFAIASEINAELDVVRVDPDTVVLDLDVFILDEGRRDLIVQTGRHYGFSVAIVGGADAEG